MVSATNVSEFLDAVSTGFGASKLEILLAATFLVLVAGAFALYSIWSAARRTLRRRKAERRSWERVEARLSKGDMDEEEQAVVRKLAKSYLPRSAGPHDLLDSQRVFDAAVRRLLENEEHLEPVIPRLRFKLGFSAARKRGILRSSVDIPTGATVWIRSRDRGFVKTRVFSQHPSFFVVSLPQGYLRENSRVAVCCKTAQGLCLFVTRVLRIDSDLLKLAHTEEVSVVQRRNYYRARPPSPLPAVILRDSGERVRTVFREIGGGGGTVVNPEGALSGGETVKIGFRLPGGETVAAKAKTVRTSRSGKLAHLEFTDISEQNRDDIIGYVLTTRNVAARPA